MIVAMVNGHAFPEVLYQSSDGSPGPEIQKVLYKASDGYLGDTGQATLYQASDGCLGGPSQAVFYHASYGGLGGSLVALYKASNAHLLLTLEKRDHLLILLPIKLFFTAMFSVFSAWAPGMFEHCLES